MIASTWPLLVRRSALEGAAAGGGGRFRRAAVPPFPVPGRLAGDFGVYCADTTERVVALTYDDGPHPEHTPRLLDVLADQGATATFFVLAPQVVKHPTVARRIVADGHEIALHGPHHRSLLTMGDREAVVAVRGAREQVEDAVGTAVGLYRPPYGHHTPGQARGIRASGLELVIWSADALDWRHDSVENIVARVRAGVFAGGVVLMHDHRADPEAATDPLELPRFDRSAVLTSVLSGLAQDGFRTTTVGGLLRAYRPVRSRSATVRPSG